MVIIIQLYNMLFLSEFFIWRVSILLGCLGSLLKATEALERGEAVPLVRRRRRPRHCIDLR